MTVNRLNNQQSRRREALPVSRPVIGHRAGTRGYGKGRGSHPEGCVHKFSSR